MSNHKIEDWSVTNCVMIGDPPLVNEQQLGWQGWWEHCIEARTIRDVKITALPLGMDIIGYGKELQQPDSANATIERLRTALLKCQTVLMASQYEPGPDEPPVLRDGVIDKALLLARDALARS